MKFLDRLLTIILTVVITSLVWILFGGALLNGAVRMGVPGASNVVAAREAATQPSSQPGGYEQPDPPSERDDYGEPGSTRALPPVTAPTGSARGIPALTMPVQGISPSEITDTFMDDRGDGTRKHEAVDIMAAEGRAVVAAAPGTIAKLHMSGPGGNSIYVRSPDRRTIYYYAHLANYAPTLKEGQQVRAGDRLGTVGSTGNADPSAPHLHFAILQTTADSQWWEPANAVNPYPLLSRLPR